jgi:hypothetical protein
MNEASACCRLHHICWLMAIFAGLHSGLCGCGCCTECSSSQNTLELSDLRGISCTAVVFHPVTHVPVTLYCCHRHCPLLEDSHPLACDLLCFFTLNTVKTNKVLGLILLLFSVMFLCPRCCGMLFILVLLSCNSSSSLLDCHTCQGIGKKNCFNLCSCPCILLVKCCVDGSHSLGELSYLVHHVLSYNVWVQWSCISTNFGARIFNFQGMYCCKTSHLMGEEFHPLPDVAEGVRCACALCNI